MAKRVCGQPGCPTISDGPRCTEHARPNANARGYDAAHRQERAKWQLIISKTGWPCSRCEGRIQPNDDWHLDHTDDRDGYLGPSHARCNLSAAGKKSHQQ